MSRDDGLHRCTDLANAGSLARFYGNRLRFISTWKRWHVWRDGRWTVDDDGQAMRYAQDTSRQLTIEAEANLAQAEAEEGQAAIADGEPKRGRPRRSERIKAAEAWVKWTVRSQNSERLQAMLKVASDFAGLAIPHTQLDNHHMLLVAGNGVINLQSGALQPFDPDLWITARPDDTDGSLRREQGHPHVESPDEQ